MSFDPHKYSNNNKVAKFDPFKYTQNNQAPTQQAQPQPAPEAPSWAADIDAAYADPNATAKKIGEYGRAVLTGVSDTMSNVLDNSAKGGTYLLEKIGAISPKTKDQVNKSLDNFFKYGKKEALYPGDPFAQAAEAHPYVTGAAQIVSALPIYGATTAPASLLGGSKLAAGALNTGITAAQAAGSASDLPQEAQDSAAKWGAGIYAALGAGGAMLSNAAAKPLAKQELTQIAAPYADKSILRQASQLLEGKVKQVMAENNALFQPLREMPGSIQKYNAKELINGMLTSGDDVLSGVQKRHLQDVAKALDSTDDMAKALDLRNVIKDGTSLFKNGVASPAYVKQYKALLGDLENQINSVAASNGLKTDLKTALDHYANQVVPLKKAKALELLDLSKRAAKDPMWEKAYTKQMNSFFKGFGVDADRTKAILPMLGGKGQDLAQQVAIQKFFGNLLDSPDALKPNQLLGKINTWDSKFKNVLSPENRKVFDGAKKLLNSVGAVAGKPEGSTIVRSAERLAGTGTVGSSLGYLAGGPVGAAVGLGVGIAGPIAANKAIKAMLNSSVGIHILKGIAEGRPWLNATKKAIATMTPEDLIRLQYPEDQDE